METIETKKDSRKIEISKNAIIVALSVALVIISAIAICLVYFREERGGRDEYGRGRMMGQYSQYGGYYGYNNLNSNDVGIPNNQNTVINPSTKTTNGTTPTVPPVTTPKTQ